jgi:hypothetical protein
MHTGYAAFLVSFIIFIRSAKMFLPIVGRNKHPCLETESNAMIPLYHWQKALSPADKELGKDEPGLLATLNLVDLQEPGAV